MRNHIAKLNSTIRQNTDFLEKRWTEKVFSPDGLLLFDIQKDSQLARNNPEKYADKQKKMNTLA